ncbi:MFS transporter [Secundilactobacillus collinoides]|uniref:MFS transporter n=1 Tax=Secundilactobacillus collinoides TaxID=33960 RepID=UPI001585061F|nr:MFS transporter [Secundilactobacillus collinoides]
MAVAILFVVIYVRRQLKLPAPILNFKIFHSKKYALATIIASLNFAMVMAAMYILPQMLQSGLQFSVSEAGLILLPAGVVNAFVALMAGRLYDSFGAKGLVQIGAILALIGILLLLRVQAGTSLWYIIGVDIILMAGSGFCSHPPKVMAWAIWVIRIQTMAVPL